MNKIDKIIRIESALESRLPKVTFLCECTLITQPGNYFSVAVALHVIMVGVPGDKIEQII